MAWDTWQQELAEVDALLLVDNNTALSALINGTTP